jgi:hypothetical protein
MDCQIEHLLGDFFIRNVTEIIRFFANLVGIADGARHALAARFGQYDPAFLFDRRMDSKGPPAGLALGGDVVRNFPIEFVDLTPRRELIDLDRARASLLSFLRSARRGASSHCPRDRGCDSARHNRAPLSGRTNIG